MERILAFLPGCANTILNLTESVPADAFRQKITMDTDTSHFVHCDHSRDFFVVLLVFWQFGGFGGGFGGSFGGGYGDFGFGGYGGYGKGAFGLTNGLMGALGGLSGAFGSYGGGGSGSLDLSLEVVVEELAEPIEVLLVFTQASDRDICTGQSVGPVLTR